MRNDTTQQFDRSWSDAFECGIQSRIGDVLKKTVASKIEEWKFNAAYGSSP